MEDYKLIDVAYGALLHDIGKFYQRTFEKSNLTNDELAVTKYDKKTKRSSYLHSGYTLRFLKKYLGMKGEWFDDLVSRHHQNEPDDFSKIIRTADHLASAIDRKDEQYDEATNNKKGNFIRARLHSVLCEVFDENKEDRVFLLNKLTDMNDPISDFKSKGIIDSAKEYEKLFHQFKNEISSISLLKNNRSFISYNYMYNLMNKYLVTIPASTYSKDGNVKATVSLFDHHKLTSAIASCLYDETCFRNELFCMLEIDVSGIQNFIYKIVEGSGTKPKLSKALRGRSILVGLITNAISYAFLNEFGLTVSNILFNTGGGSMILLPYNQTVEERIAKVTKRIRKNLFELFQTDITFVNAMVVLNKEELEEFQSDKAIKLKENLGRNKMKKFIDVIDDNFFYEPLSINNRCHLCGRISENEQCDICNVIEDISDIYTKNEKFGIVYDFSNELEIIGSIGRIDLGFVQLLFVKDKKFIEQKYRKIFYVDSINGFGFGNEIMTANDVPLDKDSNTILSFEKILKLTPEEYGDKKLAILKMDVDNLGAIFAFGLRNAAKNRKQRSISKYVTMSRLINFFFEHEIKNICRDVSVKVNKDIDSKVSNETMFYINYAGGDDLVIIGSAYSIVMLSLEIYKRFKKFAGNEYITISGGINFQSDKKPIRFGVQEAEKALSMSKEGEKNAITLLNTTISFKDYEDILDEVFMMYDWLKDQKISRTMLYNILLLIKNNNNYIQFISLIPRIQYTLFRLVSDEEVLKKMRMQINIISDNKAVKEYILKLKLVMLFTRDN